MNRPIKFRGWDKQKSVMDDHDQLVRYGMSLNDFALSKRYEFMQFTGLTDKNGREIYEGDVVMLHRGWNWIVKWGDEHAKFYLIARHPKEPTRYIMESATKLKKGEIIGNIYENPELLSV